MDPMFDREFTSEGDAIEWVSGCQDPTESSQRSKHVQQQKAAGLIPNTWEHQQRLKVEEDETPKKAENSQFVRRSDNNGAQKVEDNRITHKLSREMNEEWKRASKFLYNNTRSKNKFLRQCLACFHKDPMFIYKMLEEAPEKI